MRKIVLIGIVLLLMVSLVLAQPNPNAKAQEKANENAAFNDGNPVAGEHANEHSPVAQGNFVLPLTHFDDFSQGDLVGWSIYSRGSHGVTNGKLWFQGQVWPSWRPYSVFELPPGFSFKEVEWEISALVDGRQYLVLDARSGGSLHFPPLDVVPVINGNDFYIIKVDYQDGRYSQEEIYRTTLTTGFHVFNINWNKEESLYTISVDGNVVRAEPAVFTLTGVPAVQWYNTGYASIDYFRYTILA